MKIIIWTCPVFVLLTYLLGCVSTSPYQQQANELRQAYDAGYLTTDQYYARLNELRALDQQRQQAAANAFIQMNNQNQQMQMQQEQLRQQQQQQMLQNIRNNQIRSGYGTINGPSGPYQYNWTEY